MAKKKELTPEEIAEKSRELMQAKERERGESLQRRFPMPPPDR